MKFLYCSDIHITNRIWKGIPQIAGDAMRVCQEINTLCRNSADSNIVLGGDTFDSVRVTAYDLTCYRMLVAGLNVWHIDGTHDPEFEGCDMHYAMQPMQDCTGIVTSRRGDLKGLEPFGYEHAWGIAYQRTRELFLAELERVPADVRILFIHNAFRHLLGHEGAWAVQAEDIPEHIQCVFAGDVHTVDARTTNEGKTLIISTGSAYPRNIRQAREVPKVVIMDTENIRMPEWHDISVRNYAYADGESTIQDLKDLLGLMPRNSLMTVLFYSYTDPSVIPDLKAGLRDDWVIPVFVRKPVEQQPEATVETAFDSGDVHGAFSEFFNDETIAEQAIRLYEAPDTKAEIAEWMKVRNIQPIIRKE